MRQFPRWVRAALFLVALTLSGCSGGISGTDVEQPRLDTPAPQIQRQDAVGQRFVATQPGLNGVEMILAVYPNPVPSGDLEFRLYDDQGRELRRASLPLAALRHNDPIRFEFAPLPDSAGRQYTFTLSGPADNPATVWSSKDDVYAGGEMLVDGQPQPRDLDFKTYFRMGYGDLAGVVAQDAWNGLGLVVPLLAVFFVPGYGLTLWLDRNRAGPAKGYSALRDLPGRFALSLGLSLAVWPLLFLVLSVTPIRLNASVVWALVLLMLAAIAAVHAQRWRRGGADASLRGRLREMSRDDWLVTITFILLVIIIASLRVLHVFSLAVAPWVDSIEHAVGVRLFAEGGRLPATWGPDVYDVPFIYHFGFHSVTAVFTWLAGLSIPSAMLVAGQVINTLVAIGVYLLTARLTGRRGAGLVAMTVVGVVSQMPAYYVTWGRYTQLTGLALLPAAAVLAFDALDARPPVARRIVLAGVAASAMFVTHYRVLLMYAALVGAYLVVETVAAIAQRRAFASLWARAGLLAAVALIIALPWETRLTLTLVQTGSFSAWMSGSASFNAPHWGLLAFGHQQELVLLSLLGALIGFWLRPRFVAVVLLSTALTVFVTNPTVVGLSSSWIFSNDSLIITAFLPLAMLSGYGVAALCGPDLWVIARQWRWVVLVGGLVLLVGAALWAVGGALPLVADRWQWVMQAGAVTLALGAALWVAEWLRRAAPEQWYSPRRWTWPTRIVLAVLLVVVALRAADDMLTVVNPITVLATSDDMVAAAWIRDNVPPTARFLVNSRSWQEGAYAATDGGGWLSILADRPTTLPPISYAYASSNTVIDRVTRAQRTVSEATSADALKPVIQGEGATHVYIGAKGGPLKPEMFLNTSGFRLLYRNGPTWVFEILPGFAATP
ncbi:MAG: DUF6541 family protein [Anaerolineae bacterium]